MRKRSVRWWVGAALALALVLVAGLAPALADGTAAGSPREAELGPGNLPPGWGPGDPVVPPPTREKGWIPPPPWKVHGDAESVCFGMDDDGDGWCDAWHVPDLAELCCDGRGGDPNDGDPTVFPGAPEICDGQDNDGDGIVDEGCTSMSVNPYQAPGHWVTRVQDGGTAHAAAWNGHGFGVLYPVIEADGNGLEFLGLREDGEAAGDPVAVTFFPTAAILPRDPSLAWTGSGYGAAWAEPVPGGGTAIRFARLDPDGVREGDVETVAWYGNTDQGRPWVAWNGTEFVVAWRQESPLGDHSVHFARREERFTGGQLEVTWFPVTVASIGRDVPGGPVLEWAEGTWGFLWTRTDADGGTVLVYDELDRHGIVLAHRVLASGLDGGANAPIDLAWSGGHLAATWVAGGVVRLARFDAAASAEPEVVDAFSTSGIGRGELGVEWDGQVFVVAGDALAFFLDETGLPRVDLPDGEPDGTDDDVFRPENALRGSATWTGRELALIGPGGGTTDVTRFRPWPDRDGDGKTMYPDKCASGGNGGSLAGEWLYGKLGCDVNDAYAEPGVEACNGLDDDGGHSYPDHDCWTPGHPAQSPVDRVTFQPTPEMPGEIAWNGSLFGLVYDEDTDDDGLFDQVWFLAVDEQGNPVPGSRLHLGSGQSSHNGMQWIHPRIAWAGPAVGWGVAWPDVVDGDEELVFARVVEEDGEFRVVVHERVGAAPGWVRDVNLAWDGEAFGITWVEDRAEATGGSYQVYFARVNPEGRKLELEHQVSRGDWPVFPDLAWNRVFPYWPGSGPNPVQYLVVWQGWDDSGEDVRQVRGVLVDEFGRPGDDVYTYTDSPCFSLRPTVAWVSVRDRWLLVWADERTGNREIWALTLPWEANPEWSVPHQVTHLGASYADHPRLSGPWGFTRDGRDTPMLGLVYDASEPSWASFETHLVAIDGDGNPLSPTMNVSEADGHWSMWPRVTWTGERFGVTWYDLATGGGDVYLRRSCP